jgi:hypothetical protein
MPRGAGKGRGGEVCSEVGLELWVKFDGMTSVTSPSAQHQARNEDVVLAGALSGLISRCAHQLRSS